MSRGGFQLADVRSVFVAAKRAIPDRVRRVASCSTQLTHVLSQYGTRNPSVRVLDSMSGVHLGSRVVRPAERTDRLCRIAAFSRLLSRITKNSEHLRWNMPAI